MKFAILGATGRTGGQLVQLTLDRGHEVIAVCRNPSKLTVRHENLQVEAGDVFSAESMTPLFKGCVAVLSCLGTDGGIIKATTLYSDSIKAIAAAMREAGVERLVCMSSWFTSYSQSDGGSFYIEWIMKPLAHLFLGRVLYDMSVMEQYALNNCQDINFTVVRPPGLVDKPLTDKTFRTQDLQYVPESPGMIARADVARFMLDALDTTNFDKKVIAMGY